MFQLDIYIKKQQQQHVLNKLLTTKMKTNKTNKKKFIYIRANLKWLSNIGYKYKR